MDSTSSLPLQPTQAGSVAGTSQPLPPSNDGQQEPRLCAECAQPIPAKRLMAQPEAIMCVPCLERAGDVQRIKRFDEAIGPTGEEVVETYYQHNPYIENQLGRLNSGYGWEWGDTDGNIPNA